MQSMTGLTLKLLGDFSAQYNLQPLQKFRSNRVQALLIYLAETPGEIHQREALMELFWQDMTLKSAQTNLRQTTYLLNRAIPQLPDVNKKEKVPLVLAERKTIQLHPDASIDLDTAAFRALKEQFRHNPEIELLTKAAELYRGDFVQNFYLPDSAPFEEWVLARREAYRKEIVDMLTELMKKCVEEGSFDRAEDAARKQIEIAPLYDAAHLQLIEILARRGRRSEALAHYARYQALLDRELGLKPTESARLLRRQIIDGFFEQPPQKARQQNLLSEEAGSSTIVVGSTPGHDDEIVIRNNLPVELSKFIGREAELESLGRMIGESAARLITILGAGGMGKTRLALTSANSCLQNHAFPDGVFFVDLAPLTDPSQITFAVAESIGLQMEGGSGRTTKQQLLDYLHKKSLLLVMDNYEHLQEGASLLSEIIERAPAVKVLATSRERLNLRVEHIFPLEGFTRFDHEKLDKALNSPGVELFVYSARRVRPDFTLIGQDLPDLRRIVDMVDGMPLAIELAAGWVDTLSVADIAAEMKRDLNFLASEVDNLPERQQSVRGTFNYSWNRLTAREQKLFASLSVFRGGFTRRAAEEIAGASLRDLSHLVNKSFLRFNPTRSRYELHELIRQFGAEYLARDEDQEQKVRKNHCHYYSDYLQALGEELKGKRQLEALEEIRIDLDNGRAAWDWAIKNRDLKNLYKTHYIWYEVLYKWDTRYEDVQDLIRKLQAITAESSTDLARQIEFFIHMLSCELNGRLVRVQEMHQATNKALKLLSEPPLNKLETWPGRYFAQAILSNYVEDYQQGIDLCQACVDYYREKGDQYGLAVSLFEFSVLHDRMGDINTRKKLLDETLKITQSLGDMIYSGVAKMELVWVAHELGQFAAAKKLAEEVLDEAKKVNRHWGIANCYRILGWNGLLSGDFAAAYHVYQASLKLYEEYGYEYEVGQARYDLGQTSLHRGDLQKARYWLESVPIDLLKKKNDIVPAITKALLGQLALAEGKQQKSAILHRESIELLRPFADKLWWFPQFLTLYAISLIINGEVEKGGKLIEESITTASKDPRWHAGLILTGAATYFAKRGEVELAVEIFAAACSHPHIGKSSWYQNVVGKFIEQRAENLPVKVIEAAHDRGKKEQLSELQTVIENLANQLIP